MSRMGSRLFEEIHAENCSTLQRHCCLLHDLTNLACITAQMQQSLFAAQLYTYP